MIRRQRQVALVSIPDSADMTVLVGSPGIPVGSMLVAFMTKGVDQGVYTMVDTKSNTYTKLDTGVELVDNGAIAVVAGIVTTGLSETDTFTFSHGTAFGEKSVQLQEFRASGVMSIIQSSSEHTLFPHGQPRGSGTLSSATVGDLAVAGFMQNTTLGVGWTEGSGCTPLGDIDVGDHVSFAELRQISSTASYAPQSTSSVDTSGAGASILLRGAAPTGPPVNNDLPTAIGTVQSGEILECNTGAWSPGGDTYTFAWKIDGTTKATTDTYTPAQLDVGHTLTVVVTAVNTLGTASATSTGVLVAQGPAPPAPGTIFFAIGGEWQDRALRYPQDGAWT